MFVISFAEAGTTDPPNAAQRGGLFPSGNLEVEISSKCDLSQVMKRVSSLCGHL